jgi:hypothetical protein
MSIFTPFEKQLDNFEMAIERRVESRRFVPGHSHQRPYQSRDCQRLLVGEMRELDYWEPVNIDGGYYYNGLEQADKTASCATSSRQSL